MSYRGTLEKIGLSKKEADIYLTLLEYGPQKANLLGRRAKIDRSNVYYQLENLKEKGLVSLYTEGDDTTYFKAEAPEALPGMLERRRAELAAQINDLQYVVPELEALSTGARRPEPKLRLFEGEEGVRSLYEDILGYKNLAAMVNIDRVNEYFPQYGLQFSKEIRKREIKARELVVQSKNAKKYQTSAHHTVRLLPKTTRHEADILIYDTNVAFISYDGEPRAYVIEDPIIATAERSMFDALWIKTK